jgi:hypothetical protein
MTTENHSEPTYTNQLWHARKLLAEKGLEALYNPHAMVGRICGCKSCFCCAALQVYTEAKSGYMTKEQIANAPNKIN